MAGRGPRPKDAHLLAGHGRAKAREAEIRVYTAAPVAQPALPQRWMIVDGKKRRVAWPAATKTWWDTWGAEEMTRDWRPTDWDFLADTALIHAEVWGGNLAMLNELRVRVAKMGATSEDRARLRITYANADRAEQERAAGAAAGPGSARARRGPLKAV